MIIKALGLVVLLLYLLATVKYYLDFVTQKSSWHLASTRVLCVAVAFHLVNLAQLTRALGHIPILSVFEVLTCATFLFAVVYLVLERMIKDKSLGVLIAPILFFFQAVALTGLDLTPQEVPEELTGIYFLVHVIMMMMAYSGFAVAFIAGIMHLLLAREIHAKRLGFFFSRLPSLGLLDRLNGNAATLGFVFSTGGLLCGIAMAFQYWNNPLPLDPKFVAFVLTWILYLFHLVARHLFGWGGQRAAWLSVVGFIWVVVNLLTVSLYFTKLHLFL